MAAITELQARAGSHAASAEASRAQAALLAEKIPQIHETIQLLRAQTAQTWQQRGLTQQQSMKLVQELNANLPEVERAIKDLEVASRTFGMVGHQRESEARETLLGAMGAIVKILSGR